MSPLQITLLFFGVLFIVLFAGVPLVFTMGGVAVIFALLLWGPNAPFAMAMSMYNKFTSFILIAIPLFILMANILEKSGIADDLYELMFRTLGKLRGGLAIGTVAICAVFAAMTGITGAATVTMGVISLPAMLKRGYDKRIAIGCISAGGALGVLIPPSVLMILYCAVTQVSVGAMFAGGIIPGFLLALFFIIYIAVRCFWQPSLGPAITKEEIARTVSGSIFSRFRGVILAVVIVAAVAGSIISGAATPSEAAAIGVFAALVSTIITRRFSWVVLKDSLSRTARLSCMIMWILEGAAAFTMIYQGLGGDQFVKTFVGSLALNKWAVLAIINLVWFILGCLMDPNGIIMITMPIFFPLAVSLGFDPVWFGVSFVINMEMSYLTPPFGFNLFYMKSIAPPGVTMQDIYRSIWPFVSIQALLLMLVILVPSLIIWLPNTLIK